MGGALAKTGNVFTGNDDMVNGTTQTAGQWKQDGLSSQDIRQLGTTPSGGTQFARGAIKTGLGALSGLGQAQRPQQMGQPTMIQPPQNPYPALDQMMGNTRQNNGSGLSSALFGSNY